MNANRALAAQFFERAALQGLGFVLERPHQFADLIV